MTKEEAISEWTFRSNHIKRWLKEYGEEPSIRHYVELIDMAIEALQTKTDGDLISRADAVNEIHKYFVEEIDKTPTEIDEDGDELYADMPTVNSLLACNKELSKRIKSLPSADRPSGEWVIRKNGNKECSLCGHERQDGWDYFCGYCGAKMGRDTR